MVSLMSSFLARISSSSHGYPLLHAIERSDFSGECSESSVTWLISVMGSHRTQPLRPRPHVLLLLSLIAWCTRLVEAVGHDITNHPVCPRPGSHLFRLLHLLCIRVLASTTTHGLVHRYRILCSVWSRSALLLSCPLYWLLQDHLQDTEEKGCNPDRAERDRNQRQGCQRKGKWTRQKDSIAKCIPYRFVTVTKKYSSIVSACLNGQHMSATTRNDQRFKIGSWLFFVNVENPLQPNA